jgi:hypothetical protein
MVFAGDPKPTTTRGCGMPIRDGRLGLLAAGVAMALLGCAETPPARERNAATDEVATPAPESEEGRLREAEAAAAARLFQATEALEDYDGTNAIEEIDRRIDEAFLLLRSEDFYLTTDDTLAIEARNEVRFARIDSILEAQAAMRSMGDTTWLRLVAEVDSAEVGLQLAQRDLSLFMRRQ